MRRPVPIRHGTRLAFLLGVALVAAAIGCGGGAPDPAVETTLRLEAPGAGEGIVAVAPAAADSATPVPSETLPDSDSAGALLGLSRALFAAGRHEEAITRLAPHRPAWDAALRGEASEWSEGDARELLVRLALHHAATGSIREVAGARAQLAADTTRSGLSASRLAYLELRGEDFARASAPAARAFHADSTRAERLNNFGITRLQAGAVAHAERLFHEAIRRDPDLPGPYYNLAILAAFYRMDPEAGRRWFAEYRRRALDDPDHLAEALAEPAARAETEGGEP